MAIVNLGSLDIVIGQGFYEFIPFNYRDDSAYAIYADFVTNNFSSLFSFIRIYPYVEPNNGTPRLLSRHIDLEILAESQLFYLPFSNLIDGNGDCTLYVERLSRYTGGGEGETVNLTLSYDDSIRIGTWL